jgi:hypothetical protein
MKAMYAIVCAMIESIAHVLFVLQMKWVVIIIVVSGGSMPRAATVKIK